MNGFCFPVVLGAEREMMWFLSLGSSQAQQGRQACKEILPVLFTCSKCPLRSCGPGAESPARTDCPGRAKKVSQRCDLSAWSSLFQLGKWDEGFHPAVSQLPKQTVSQSQWFNITKSVRSFFLMPWPLCSEWLFPKGWLKGSGSLELQQVVCRASAWGAESGGKAQCTLSHLPRTLVTPPHAPLGQSGPMATWRFKVVGNGIQAPREHGPLVGCWLPPQQGMVHQGAQNQGKAGNCWENIYRKRGQGGQSAGLLRPKDNTPRRRRPPS